MANFIGKTRITLGKDISAKSDFILNSKKKTLRGYGKVILTDLNELNTCITVSKTNYSKKVNECFKPNLNKGYYIDLNAKSNKFSVNNPNLIVNESLCGQNITNSIEYLYEKIIPTNSIARLRGKTKLSNDDNMYNVKTDVLIDRYYNVPNQSDILFYPDEYNIQSSIDIYNFQNYNTSLHLAGNVGLKQINFNEFLAYPDVVYQYYPYDPEFSCNFCPNLN